LALLGVKVTAERRSIEAVITVLLIILNTSHFPRTHQLQSPYIQNLFATIPALARAVASRMASCYRPSKPVIIVYIAFLLIYFTSRHYPASVPRLHWSAKPGTFSSWSNSAANSDGNAKQEIHENAHRLPNADAFFPHFRAVTKTLAHLRTGNIFPSNMRQRVHWRRDRWMNLCVSQANECRYRQVSARF
jgi:hypothetical protein